MVYTSNAEMAYLRVGWERAPWIGQSRYKFYFQIEEAGRSLFKRAMSAGVMHIISTVKILLFLTRDFLHALCHVQGSEI